MNTQTSEQPQTLKAELKFTYDPTNPEDLELIKRVTSQVEYKYEMIIGDVLNKIRAYLKWGHSFKNADEALESIRDFIHEQEDD